MFTIAGDASRDVASNATLPAVFVVVALLVLSVVGARWFTHTHDTLHGSVAWFAAFGSVGGCLALTLFREGFRFAFQPSGVLAWTTAGWDRLADGDLIGSSQFLLNVALFVPAGIAWTWVTGRPLRTFGGLVGLTMAIESVQGITGAGGADITDVAANAFGAALGVGTAAMTTAALVRAGVVTGTASSPRRRASIAAGLVIVVAIAVTALFAGADRRQARVHDELVAMFADVTYAEVDALVRPDPDRPGDANSRFVDSGQIFGAISERADGFRYIGEQIELRWPALFFGFRRCVYVTWTPSGVEFSDVSGQACTDFIG